MIWCGGLKKERERSFFAFESCAGFIFRPASPQYRLSRLWQVDDAHNMGSTDMENGNVWEGFGVPDVAYSNYVRRKQDEYATGSHHNEPHTRRSIPTLFLQKSNLAMRPARVDPQTTR